MKPILYCISYSSAPKPFLGDTLLPPSTWNWVEQRLAYRTSNNKGTTSLLLTTREHTRKVGKKARKWEGSFVVDRIYCSPYSMEVLTWVDWLKRPVVPLCWPWCIFYVCVGAAMVMTLRILWVYCFRNYVKVTTTRFWAVFHTTQGNPSLPGLCVRTQETRVYSGNNPIILAAFCGVVICCWLGGPFPHQRPLWLSK